MKPKATRQKGKKSKIIPKTLETAFSECENYSFDRVFLLLVLFLLTAGSLMVFSASRAYSATHLHDEYYFTRLQLLFAAVGVFVMLIVSKIPPRLFYDAAPYAYIASALLLILVLLFGAAAGGAKRWLSIGFLSFQPSELAKTSLILFLARYFTDYREKVLFHSEKWQAFLYGILIPAGITGLYIALILLQKHLSCIIILCILTVIMMFIGGSELKRVSLVAVPAVSGIAAFALLTDYTRRRIMIWLNPELYPQDGGWQTLQGLMAIGSGGLFGLGFGNSRLKYSYVSEPQNDFIFTVVCEELGFVGAILLLILFSVFVVRGFRIGLSHPDPFPRLLAVGLSAKVGVQTLLNLAVITNILPNTGISLPFFSYGGSSLVMLMAEMGMILSVSRTSLYRR